MKAFSRTARTLKELKKEWTRGDFFFTEDGGLTNCHVATMPITLIARRTDVVDLRFRSTRPGIRVKQDHQATTTSLRITLQ